MKITKVVLLLLAITLINIEFAQAGLIRTSDGGRIELSDLPFTTDTVLEYDNDQLIGAFNVDVAGVGIFDVDFIDQAFNQISEFDIIATTLNVGAFTSSLIDNVFVNVGSFLFDDIPSLTFGCEQPSICIAFVPISVSGNAVSAGSAVNQSLASSQADRIETTLVSATNDLSGASAAIFARFTNAPTRVAPPVPSRLQAAFQLTPQAQDVPEPSSLFLAAIGIIGIAFYRRSNLPKK
jgi:hypothetical protein